jgi:hypothetical protein
MVRHPRRVSALRTLSPREASIFACLCDTVVRPRPPLPEVRDTDAVAAFDRWLAAAPQPNRIGLRVLLHLAELGALACGFGSRLRRLDPDSRLSYVRRVERTGQPQLRQLAKLVNGMAFVCYYGDDAVMRTVGYDADANVRRGRELRAREGRQ